MGTYTPNLGLYKPDIGEIDWGELVNQNFDILDDKVLNHTHDASAIISGRLPLSRLPDGEFGKLLMATGEGNDPVWADPDMNIIRVSGTDQTPRDWSKDFEKLQLLPDLLSAIQKLKKHANNYRIITIDLSTERTDEPLNVSGIDLTFLRISDNAEFSIKFNSTNNDALTHEDVDVGDRIEMEFTEIYISNPAKNGEFIKIWVGVRE